MKITFSLVLLLATVQPIWAQAYYCDRPRKPYIPTDYDSYETMQSAEYDVDRYLRKMKEYVSCLVDEQNDAVDESNRLLRNWNIAVDTFNSR